MRKFISLLLSGSLVVSAKPVDIKLPEIVLTQSNHATLIGEVTGQSVKETIDKLRKLDNSKTRYLYINSPGGEVQTGIRLVNYLQSAEGKGIICVADTAISMAMVSMQACETRVTTPNATFMSHGIAGGVQGYTRKVESDLTIMKGFDYILAKIQAERMGITVEELRKRQNEEYWIIGSEAIIAANAADKVAKVSCGSDMLVPVEVDGTDDEGKVIKVKKILCPL